MFYKEQNVWIRGLIEIAKSATSVANHMIIIICGAFSPSFWLFRFRSTSTPPLYRGSGAANGYMHALQNSMRRMWYSHEVTKDEPHATSPKDTNKGVHATCPKSEILSIFCKLKQGQLWCVIALVNMKYGHHTVQPAEVSASRNLGLVNHEVWQMKEENSFIPWSNKIFSRLGCQWYIGVGLLDMCLMVVGHCCSMQEPLCYGLIKIEIKECLLDRPE